MSNSSQNEKVSNKYLDVAHRNNSGIQSDFLNYYIFNENARLI